MQVTVWTAKEPRVTPNGMGFDIDFELDGDGIRDFFNHVDEADAVAHIGKTALLDEIGQEKAEDHFDLVPKSMFEEMEQRAIAAEEKLASPEKANKEYTDFEEL